jgi:phospholipase/carboxylesterase
MLENQPELVVLDGWTFRIKKSHSQLSQNRILLLLHGHLGNENVMWVFTNQIPEDYTLISPRAPQKMGPDQYSWHGIGPQWPGIESYKEIIQDLLAKIEKWMEINQITEPEFDVLGFSQGAVLAYALAMIHPEKINKIAAIAGFIPESWKNALINTNLSNKEFFIAHGTQDDIIPISKAKKASEWIEMTGAQVTFCEANTGHKISSNCYNGLGEFFE